MSCADKKLPSDLTGDISEIYGFVFDIIATRADPSVSWYKIIGAGNFALERGDTPTKGTAYQSFFSYTEPQFCALGQTCDCTGTVQNNFTLSTETPSLTPSSPVNAPYNVFDPYSAPIPASSSNSPTGEIYKIYTYLINLSPIANNLTIKCRPQIDRPVTIIRYFSGDLVIKDGYRELLLRPRIK